jgi:hypothetical protein
LFVSPGPGAQSAPGPASAHIVFWLRKEKTARPDEDQARRPTSNRVVVVHICANFCPVVLGFLREPHTQKTVLANPGLFKLVKYTKTFLLCNQHECFSHSFFAVLREVTHIGTGPPCREGHHTTPHRSIQ